MGQKLRRSIKALKTEDYANNEVVVDKGTILGFDDKDTEYGERKIMSFKHDGEEKNVFLNQTSQDNLIDAFGEDCDSLIGEQIKITCKKGEGKYKNLMLVVEPIAN